VDYQRLITPRARSVDTSGIRRVFDLAAKVKNPVNFSIGQPHFDVPQPVKSAAIEAIQAGRNSYTPTQGIAPLTTKINAQFDARFRQSGRWSDYGTLVTSGVSGGLLLAIMACAGPGDEVLVPDPYFVMYSQFAKLAGARPVFVDTYPDFQLTAERVAPHLTDRTKLVLISSPSNPTGAVTDERTWADLVDLCVRRNVLLVSDEIYDVFCYRPVDTPIGPRCPSPASLSDQVLVLRGFSKTYAMTGWRLGYAVGPRPIIEQMTKLQQYTFVCAPSPVQHAGLVALDVDMSAQVADYRCKRDRVVERLSPHFELTVPQGAFYAFPTAPRGLTGSQFVEAAIARDLLIIPGAVFSERDSHFRLSYACDDATLDRGLDLLIELARAASHA
jgi:aminotransferase